MNAGEPRRSAHSEGLAPLEGEPGIPSVHTPRKGTVAVKAILALLVVVLGLGFAVYATITRIVSSGAGAGAEDRRAPKAAVTVDAGRVFDPRKAPIIEGEAARAAAVLVPAIEPEGDADPIGVRASSEERSRTKKRSPYDAPSMLNLSSASDTRGNTMQTAAGATGTDERHDSLQRAQESLGEYQQNLKGMLSDLQRVAASTAPNPAAGSPQVTALQSAAQGAAALGGQLSVGATPSVAASHLGDRSLTLPKGTTFTCSLKTKIVSEHSGFVSCQVLRNVYSDDGRVLLVDRGSHLDGEYSARVRNGQTRIFVVWSRLRTPAGVTVDIGSPATGPLGEAGVDGYVDNHWGKRIGAALLLSLIEGGMKIAAAEAASRDNGTSVVLSDQAETTSSLAEKVLDSTINISPTIYKLQGEVVGIYVARDVDFSSVYELRAAAR